MQGPLPWRLWQAALVLSDCLSTQDHRLQLVHPATGLPTREPLAAQMTGDEQGTLAVLACQDFDRLCGFDAPAADELLRQMALRVAEMLPRDRFLAQIDRSHLAIWVGGAADGLAVRAQIDALVYALGERVHVAGRWIAPDVSSRIAYFDASTGGSSHSAISRALSAFAAPPDTALVDPSDDLARDGYELEQSLRLATAQHQLRLVYQPLVDGQRGCVCGAEALLRWDHPTMGNIPPARFVAIAEAAGLANEIGLWSLNRAIRDAAAWHGQGLLGVRTAVNISGLHITEADLPATINRMLDRHHLPPAALEIELTETVALSDDGAARAVSDRLRGRGIHLAIDDFGTGFSSLASLRGLAFDKIKIDRAFVANVDSVRANQAICSAILALGRGLEISVLAEGVETRGEFDWLRRHGCKLFQGYFFSPPLELEQFVTYARDPASLAAQLAPQTTASERSMVA